MKKFLKSIKTFIGLSVDCEKNSLLDKYTFTYVMDNNRIEIYSHMTGYTFGVNADELIDFINKNKEVIFNDF